MNFFQQFPTLFDRQFAIIVSMRLVLNLWTIIEFVRFFMGPLPEWICQLYVTPAMILTFAMLAMHLLALGMCMSKLYI